MRLHTSGIPALTKRERVPKTICLSSKNEGWSQDEPEMLHSGTDYTHKKEAA